MKVIGICGSPRKGNSERMLEEALRGCESKGAETELVLLRNTDFRGCCGRDSCFHEGNCHVRDGIVSVLDELGKADMVVLASPSYFNNVTGLMKDFMDRTNPYCKGKKWGGKKALLLSAGGAGMRSVEKCRNIMADFCNIHGIEVQGSVCAVADKVTDMKSAEEPPLHAHLRRSEDVRTSPFLGDERAVGYCKVVAATLAIRFAGRNGYPLIRPPIPKLGRCEQRGIRPNLGMKPGTLEECRKAGEMLVGSRKD